MRQYAPSSRSSRYSRTRWGRCQALAAAQGGRRALADPACLGPAQRKGQALGPQLTGNAQTRRKRAALTASLTQDGTLIATLGLDHEGDVTMASLTARLT